MACGVQLKRKEKAEVREELMIKKRLVGLLSHAKKYIIYQVVWQWLALLCQVVMIYSASMLLETGGGRLWCVGACGADPAICL